MRSTLFILSTLLTASLAAPASQAEDMQLRYISLVNNGGYIIDPVVLHWKTPDGNKKSKNLGPRIGNNEGICYDLSADNDIPDGSEVWMVAKIEAGDNESCRKDRKHMYDASSSEVWYVKMSGTTFNNNRCKNTGSGSVDGDDIIMKGNSSKCEN